MNETAEQVRRTFQEVADAVAVPPLDEVALHRRLQGDRRRRLTVWAGGVAVAASLAAVAAYGVAALVPGSGPDGTGQVMTQLGEPEPWVLPQPLYYTARGRLTAVTPDGTVHDFGQRSEQVVGATAEGVLALDDESHVLWFDARPSGEGDGRFTFTRGASPVDGAVSSVALSEDGRFVAWLGQDGRVTVRDLKADSVVTSFDAAANSYVASVSERGVLMSEDGDLVLRSADSQIRVPTRRDGDGWQSDVAGDLVSVTDPDEVTRVYDVSGGSAELVAEVPGAGRLAPHGGTVVSTDIESIDVTLWTPEGSSRLEAVQGRPESVGWLDEKTAVVTAHVDAGTALQVCQVATRACKLVAVSERAVLLAD